MAFPTIIDGQSTVTGEIGEWITNTSEDTLKLGLWVQWTAECNGCNFANNALLQHWIQWES